MRPYKYSEQEIIEWAIYYIGGLSMPQIERMTGVPDATIWWSFTHRLPTIDCFLSEKVQSILSKKNSRSKNQKAVGYIEKPKMWEITGEGLPSFYVPANSFDEALKFARKINPGYNSGRVVEEGGLI